MRGDPPSSVMPPSPPLRSTPHARGSTLNSVKGHVVLSVYPACAGIHHSGQQFKDIPYGLPRMRGDPPQQTDRGLNHRESTPHARGSTKMAKIKLSKGGVYPACAGIHRLSKPPHSGGTSLPRMRGDPPSTVSSAADYDQSTPHARGSTYRQAFFEDFLRVYPACAGIHPGKQTSSPHMESLPRMRGDPP